MSSHSDLVAYLIGLTPGAALLAWGLKLLVVPASGRAVARWAARYGLRITDGNRSLVSGYLQRTRGLRLVGSGVGWIAAELFVAGVAPFVPLFGIPLMAAIAGYLLCAAIAEATFVRQVGASTGIRSASLAPRALFDYVPGFSVWALRVLSVVLIGLALLYVIAPKHAKTPTDVSVTMVLAAAALLVLFAVGVDRLTHAIVARPQPAITTELMAADDAIRASSIHALSGAGVGVVLVGIGAVLFALQYTSADESLRGWLGYPATAAIVFSLVSWIRLGHPRTWRVRRSTQLLSAP